MEKGDLLKIIGKRIQEIRISKGYSQVDLAGKIKGSIDTTNISRIESGRTNPTIYTLHRIAEALGVLCPNYSIMKNLQIDYSY